MNADDGFDDKSDILMLQSIGEEQLYNLIRVEDLKPLSKRLIELAHQVSTLPNFLAQTVANELLSSRGAQLGIYF